MVYYLKYFIKTFLTDTKITMKIREIKFKKRYNLRADEHQNKTSEGDYTQAELFHWTNFQTA